eukprot:UN15956
MKKFYLNDKITWKDIEGRMSEVMKMEKEDEFKRAGLGDGLYGFSKALLNCYTVLLARENAKLKINPVTPGFIATDLVVELFKSQGHDKIDKT